MKATKNSALLSGLFIIAALLAFAPGCRADESVVTPAMAGHWEGQARIIVNWCQQSNLAVRVDIAPDGSVTGKIGDAMLVKGQFKSNRGWLGKKLNIKTDYIIQGDLAGPVVAAEGIMRSGVNVPLTFKEGAFKGAVHTTGSKFGGKEDMILTASPLHLTRINNSPSVTP